MEQLERDLRKITREHCIFSLAPWLAIVLFLLVALTFFSRGHYTFLWLLVDLIFWLAFVVAFVVFSPNMVSRYRQLSWYAKEKKELSEFYQRLESN